MPNKITLTVVCEACGSFDAALKESKKSHFGMRMEEISDWQCRGCGHINTYSVGRSFKLDRNQGDPEPEPIKPVGRIKAMKG